jgi:hypothetical protein
MAATRQKSLSLFSSLVLCLLFVRQSRPIISTLYPPWGTSRLLAEGQRIPLIATYNRSLWAWSAFLFSSFQSLPLGDSLLAWRHDRRSLFKKRLPDERPAFHC